MSILRFADAETENLFYGRRAKGVGPALAKQARRRLALLNSAAGLGDLASSGADLKLLEGKEAVWRTRVNQQYRLRFKVAHDAPLDVEEAWFGDPH